jgi:hypothetical protein
MGNPGYGNHDAPTPGAGAQDRPGPEGGSGEEASSPAALGVSPQDQSVSDPASGTRSPTDHSQRMDPAMTTNDQDADARNAVEGRGRAATGSDQSEGETKLPPAGPHADPDLINPAATPGTGALPPPGEHDDVDSTSG